MSVHTRYDLLLLDLIEKGTKENLLLNLLGLPSGSSVDATNLYNQKLMAEYVKNQAFDGWISCQDRSDDRLEVYIYNHIDSVIVRERIIYGP